MYKCNECGHTSQKYFGLCPQCKEGMGEEVQKISAEQSTGMYRPREESIFEGTIEIKDVDTQAVELESKLKTKFHSMNEVLSSAKGFVDSQVVVLGANPGTGKSTLLSQISDEETLYITSEESFNQVNARMIRVNSLKAKILSTTSIDEVLHAIKTTDARLIIIDSINSIEFGVGYQTTARYANDITKLIKDLNKICVIISQVTKGGEIAGMQSLIHIVDTVLHMEKSEVSNAIILASSKNRFGEVGQVAVFQHTREGLVEISIDEKDIETEVGITYTDSRFGHKNLTISVESLVADAQASYGLKKSNGFNFNVLMQLTGVLSFHSGINFNFKDVYVQIANGLSTDDVNIQLAVCNSILSSYFDKALIQKATGEVRLNGKIVNGYILDSKGNESKLNHIKDLISLYK